MASAAWPLRESERARLAVAAGRSGDAALQKLFYFLERTTMPIRLKHATAKCSPVIADQTKHPANDDMRRFTSAVIAPFSTSTVTAPTWERWTAVMVALVAETLALTFFRLIPKIDTLKGPIP
jgi:hypothetical protein